MGPRSISKTVNRVLGANQALPGHGVRCLEPAPTIDVMFDQLEYLVNHEGKGCPAGCKDCTRLRQVEDWLLQPFRDACSRQLSVRTASHRGRLRQQTRSKTS
jgi:hypothetical protein